MKRLTITKSAELLLVILLGFLCFYSVAIQSNIYFQIYSNNDLRMVYILLCVSFATVFIFILSDFFLFRRLKSNYNKLNYNMKSDDISQIANRQGVDEVISGYIGKDLPDNVACIMIFLTSLLDVNKKSRNEGNFHIRTFSSILKRAAEDKCFVGRNGGNVFIAIFENTSQEDINAFCEQLDKDTKKNNSIEGGEKIHYQLGIAFKESPPTRSINALISIAYERAKHPASFPSSHKIDNNSPVFKKQDIPLFAYVINHDKDKDIEEENDYKSFNFLDENYRYTKEEISMAYEDLKKAG